MSKVWLSGGEGDGGNEQKGRGLFLYEQKINARCICIHDLLCMLGRKKCSLFF